MKFEYFLPLPYFSRLPFVMNKWYPVTLSDMLSEIRKPASSNVLDSLTPIKKQTIMELIILLISSKRCRGRICWHLAALGSSPIMWSRYFMDQLSTSTSWLPRQHHHGCALLVIYRTTKCSRSSFKAKGVTDNL